MKVWREVLSAAVLAVALTAAASPVGAQSKYRLDPTAPLDIQSADGAGTDPVTCVTTLQGAAEVTQDRTRLHAQTIKATSAKGRDGCGDIVRVEAKGNVFYVTPDQTIRSNEAVYDLNKEIATFTGEVIARQDKDVTTAERMVIDIKSGAVQANGRFRAVIYPKSGAAK